MTNLKEKDIEQDEHDLSQHSGKQVREASDSSIAMGKKAIVSKILGSSRVQNALRELAVKEGPVSYTHLTLPTICSV